MYRRARIRLTAWYTGVMLAVLLVLGLVSYFALARSIDREVDAGIEGVVEQWLADPPPLGPPLGDIEEHELEDLSPEVFLLVFRWDGAVLLNPRQVESKEFIDHGLITQALRGVPQWSTLEEHGRRFRILASPVIEGRAVVAVVVGVRGLHPRDTQVRLVLGVLASVAVLGLGLALVAGYLLAGRALRPLRLAYERQRAFVADASHELRSPIAVIRTSADLLLREDLEPAQRASVEEVRDVAEEAGVLVDDMVELARADETADARLDDDAHADLAVVARATLERLRPLLDAHGTEVEMELRTAPSRIAEGEAARVLRALLENVLAHTPQGTAVRVETGLTGGRRRGRAVLAVEDRGPGIPEDRLADIFERFTQLDAARTPGRGRGAGLGLAIVRSIAERRGGAAAASHAAGGGLRIEVSLPAA